MFMTMYSYALRASEVALLKMSDISLDENTIRIHRLKGSISHDAPLLPAVRKTLLAWIRERGKKPGPIFTTRQGVKGITRGRIDQLIKKYCEKSGIARSKAHSHVIKHAAGTALAGRMDVQSAQMWMGHRDIRSTMKYVHLSGAHLKKVADLLQDFGRR
jgi:type 1 fimbriae regulatory protein FimB